MDGEPLDGARILADARNLAFPRYPGTDGCRRAQAIVAEWLRDAGLDVSEERFRYDVRPAFRAIRAVTLSSAALVAAAGLVAATSTPAAAALLVAGAVVGGGLLVWAPGVERVYRAEGPTETANVVGRRRVAHPRRTLVLMAHYDSKSQNLTFPWRNGAVLGALAAALALAVVLAVRLVAGGAVAPVWLAPVLGLAAAACLALLATLRSGNDSPGGVDNAGSVAILRALARHVPSRVDDDVELVVLATSAEEDHMIGAMRWLDRNLPELRDRSVEALNFDGAGAPGRPVVIERYGLGRRFAPELAQAAAAAARRLGLRPRRIWLPPAIGIDAIPFDHRGVPCLTFSSGSLGRATLAVHSRHDVADHLDPRALEEVARLAAEIASDRGRFPNRGFGDG